MSDEETQQYSPAPFQVAVVQIETHPAITVEATDYLSEPFLVDGHEMPILAKLRRYRDGGDVEGLQKALKQAYLEWSKSRLIGILEWFKKPRDGFDEINPKLIVFSEFAIPFEHLYLLKEFAKLRNCIVIAANTTFDRRGTDYEELGINVGMPPSGVRDGANSLMVVFSRPDPAGKNEEQRKGVWCRFKYKLSPFEFTSFHAEPPLAVKVDKTAAQNIETKQSTVIQFTNPFKINIEILLCAEALQNVSCGNDAHMLIVCAYHDKPDDYSYLLNQTAKLQKIAILASEGKFGGSTINLNYDRRFASWWLQKPNSGALPAGDGILVYEVPYVYTSASAGSANPFKEHKLVAIADIVSEDERDDHYVVSRQIQGCISQGCEKLVRREQEEIARRIRQILRRRKPSLLQNIKFQFLADAAQMGQLTNGLISGLTDDCSFKSQKSLDSVTSTLGSITCSLQELERRLALETDGWLREKLESGNLQPETATAFVQARQSCAKRLKRRDLKGVVPLVTDFLDKSESEIRARCLVNLNRYVGTLVERFEASLGTLFIIRGKSDSNKSRMLDELLSYNVPSGWQKLVRTIEDEPVDNGDIRCGIIVLAARNKRGYVLDDVKSGALSKFYIECMPTTLSEIVVPIFSIDGKSVEGVLNLESDELGTFLPFHLGELQAAVSQLLPDLIILKRVKGAESSAIWHPDIHGWSSSPVLQSICNIVSSSQSTHSAEQRLICTVWQADWLKAYLYVRATVGFNFEYIAKKVMPLQFVKTLQTIKDPPEIPDKSWMAGETSFTGFVAALRRGTVYQGRIAALPNYARSEKANRMGVEYLIATPIYRRFDNGRAIKPNESVESDSIGVLSLYFFRRYQPGYSVSMTSGFPEVDVVWLSYNIGEMLGEMTTLRREVAVATLLARIHSEGNYLLNLSDLLRDIVLEVLDADECTVIVGTCENYERDAEKVEVSLRYLSTTGLITDDGKLYDKHTDQSTCSLLGIVKPDFLLIEGVTSFLTVVAPSVIRKTDVQDPWEVGSWTTIKTFSSPWYPKELSPQPSRVLILPNNYTRERTVSTEADHRRLVAASIVLTNRRSAGIIRTIRRAGGRPFIEADGLVLSDMAEAFRPYFNFESDAKAVIQSNSTSVKLLARNTGAVMWNKPYIESILQYFLKALYSSFSKSGLHGASCRFDLSYLWMRSASNQSNKNFRFYAHYSLESGQIASECKTANISELNSLESFAIQSRAVVIGSWNELDKDGYAKFNLNGSEMRFKPLESSHDAGRLVVLVPFAIDSIEGLPDILLCIEGNVSIPDTTNRILRSIMSRALEYVCQCSRLLNCVARNNLVNELILLPDSDDWSTVTEIINALKHNLLNTYKITFSPVKGAKKLPLWYGCTRLPDSLLPCAWDEVSSFDDRGIEISSRNAIVLRVWRELVLRKKFSTSIYRDNEKFGVGNAANWRWSKNIGAFTPTFSLFS